MDKETIYKCIELTDQKYLYYYNEAKRVGKFDALKEKEYVCASVALKELKDELWEMWKKF
jgi:hypothetical protein